MPSTPFRIRNSSGDLIRGDMHLPEKPENAPAVILCHGFKGFKDWGYAPHAAERMADEGWCAVRFNFSHNGVGEDFLNFTEPERFAQNTFSKELEDLDAVIGAVADRSIAPAEIDAKRIALVGHSRGGGIVILKAAEDDRISCAASWAGVSGFDRWGGATKERWRREGFIEVMNTRTKQKMRMNLTLLEDLEKNPERLDILAAVRHMRKPLLIVHGEQDLSVPVAEAYELYAHAEKMLTELEIVPNADHTFGMTHPYAGTTPAFSRVLERTLLWLRINCRPKR